MKHMALGASVALLGMAHTPSAAEKGLDGCGSLGYSDAQHTCTKEQQLFNPAVAATVVFTLAAASGLAGCGGSASDTGTAQVTADASAASSGLQITDAKVGTGLIPRPGQTCSVLYTGWLYVNGAKGTKFDSSVDRKAPFSFVLGDHKVIDGWEEAVRSMRVGGKRTIIVPPALGYGSKGAGKAIPPNATLMFDIELLEVKAPA